MSQRCRESCRSRPSPRPGAATSGANWRRSRLRGAYRGMARGRVVPQPCLRQPRYAAAYYGCWRWGNKMITVRPAFERGSTQLKWLQSAHSFSFNNYLDPRHMGFRQLRVIDDDWIKPGAGFGTHSHRDMEIITYVLEG